MEKHNVTLTKGIVPAMKRIEKATGEPIHVATARTPGASMKAATGSLRHGGHRGNVVMASTKNKLDYVVRHNITDFPEDKPAELKNLALYGPPGLRVHTLKHPWTTRHVPKINKELKELGSKNKIILHDNPDKLASHIERSMKRWHTRRILKRSAHIE
jgi:hypothetical protein